VVAVAAVAVVMTVVAVVTWRRRTHVVVVGKVIDSNGSSICLNLRVVPPVRSLRYDKSRNAVGVA
jgi:hypothetical protein